MVAEGEIKDAEDKDGLDADASASGLGFEAIGVDEEQQRKEDEKFHAVREQ